MHPFTDRRTVTADRTRKCPIVSVEHEDIYVAGLIIRKPVVYVGAILCLRNLKRDLHLGRRLVASWNSASRLLTTKKRHAECRVASGIKLSYSVIL